MKYHDGHTFYHHDMFQLGRILVYTSRQWHGVSEILDVKLYFSNSKLNSPIYCATIALDMALWSFFGDDNMGPFDKLIVTIYFYGKLAQVGILLTDVVS